MEPLYIPHLTNRQDRTLEVVVDTMIADFETLTPVRGKIIVKHGGTFLDVSAQTETIVTLKCDRCLQQFNHRLVLSTSEIIWLDADFQEPTRPGTEVKNELEELVETLPPDGHFPPDVWLYEQLCLALPLRQLCNLDCEGIPPVQLPPEVQPADSVQIDRRWGILESLKHQLEQNN
jgi:uncharacterized protein